MTEVPPHPRGWSRQTVPPRQPRVGSPAPAGMVPDPLGFCGLRYGFPRTRGDGPVLAVVTEPFVVVPPHPRGWSLAERLGLHQATGSPAPAGMVRIMPAHAAAPMRFPRTRGDGPQRDTGRTDAFEVPPHPRGWSPGRWASSLTGRGSPAPAGMVPNTSWNDDGTDRFPRTRGDGPFSRTSGLSPAMVPPHPRGWSL